jgi:DNA-binding MarR family transcriptional regulator
MNKCDVSEGIDCPYFFIYRTSLLITAILKKEFILAGIDKVKAAYIGTLMNLWFEDGFEDANNRVKREGGIKVNELGKRAGLEPSTMTGLIDRMERGGLVFRRNHPTDRRAQVISLTDYGRNIQGTVMRVIDKTMDKVFDGIPEEDIEHTTGVLRHVLNNAKKGSD